MRKWLLIGTGVVAVVVLTVAVAIEFLNGGGDPPPAAPHEPGSYERPYGDAAPWNLEAAEFDRHPDSGELTSRFWKYSNIAGVTDESRRGRVMMSIDRWSSPIYDATTAEGTKRVFTASYGFPGNVTDGAEIPWADWWEPAAADDAEMIIIDPGTGREWNLWLVQKSNFSGCLGTGYVPFRDLCVGRASLVSGPDTQPIDYRTYVGGFPSKGSGLPNLALTLTAKEIADGRVEHAMGMDVYNTMFGPACTDAERSTEAAGTTCGYFVSPATRLEWLNGPATCGSPLEASPAGRSKTVAEGTRFALEISDDEIEQWLDERGHQGARRETARIIAIGLREFGWILSDTSCGGSSIPTEGVANKQTAKLWKSLGIEGDGQKDLLVGLFREDNIYALEPPAEPLPVGRTG